ncbi:ABC transporter, permease protein [Aeropyrum pernix]|uniref:ABC transporter, permease protein n=1 Tax=Aeropyrum pernix TaxID=56636 RepID=A0A401HC18_AERPX|nr:ABC transporter permease [Aeropyrum pernix]GBF09985.1 ABC transporter, permease protein [Aeropyrum pernix]
MRRSTGGSTLSREDLTAWVRVLLASAVVYAKDLLALYSTWGFMLVRLSVPMFMIATAWALSRLSGGMSPFEALGYSDYVAFVAIGFSLYSLLTATLFDVGERLHRELVQGTLEAILVTPASRFSWLFGNALGSLGVSLLDLVIILAYYTIIFGSASLHLEAAPQAAAVLALGFIGMVGMGLLLGGIIVNLKEPHAFNVMLTPFLMLLSGMMFPVEVLPSPLDTAAELIPLTLTLEAVRSLLLKGGGISSVEGLLVKLAIEAVVYTLAGYMVFKTLEERARRSGGLTKF